MNYWLIKSEPDAWSWDQQVKKGAKGEAWTGVRNHTAKQNLMKMKKGDRAFFYHSGEGKEIVGIAEVIRESFPDPSASPGDPWVAVDVSAVMPLVGSNLEGDKWLFDREIRANDQKRLALVEILRRGERSSAPA